MKARTLICHGRCDSIVSVNHGAALQKRFSNATTPFWVDDATHQVGACKEPYISVFSAPHNALPNLPQLTQSSAFLLQIQTKCH